MLLCTEQDQISAVIIEREFSVVTRITDLTHPLSVDFKPYASESYSDPHYSAQTWCTVESQGYWVSQLALGTQTGTHIDAPAHFQSGAPTLEALPVENLIGEYFFVDLDSVDVDTPAAELVDGYEQQGILFVRSSSGSASVTRDHIRSLLSLAASVWVLVGDLHIAEAPPLELHRVLADAGVYLVENVSREEAVKIAAGGKLIALPLRLEGLSGAPCRVVVIEEL